MENAAKRGYMRGARTRAAARKPAWVGPLLTFMVRRGRRFESVRGLAKRPANDVFACPRCKRLSRAGTSGVFLMFASRSREGSHTRPTQLA
jgi:hypothetical protein